MDKVASIHMGCSAKILDKIMFMSTANATGSADLLVHRVVLVRRHEDTLPFIKEVSPAQILASYC